MTRGRWVLVGIFVAAAGGCVEPAPDLAATEQLSLVGDHETSTCSTAVVLELSRQIAAEVNCMVPGQLVAFAEGDHLRFVGAAVLPYASEEGRADLLAASLEPAGGGASIEITSAYRTVVQQYLLRRWFELQRCGITAAADPGSSNHESGRAIDVSNWEVWIDALAAHDWAHDVPGDDVHFDHLMSADLSGTDVLAFQRLWNRNYPDDPISEDGDWGPMTEAAVKAAPAEGFAVGPMCAGARLDAAATVRGPGVLAPGGAGTVVLVLRNTGYAPWERPSLVTSQPVGRASGFAGPGWIAPDHPADVGQTVEPGDEVELELAVVAPAAEGEYTETFELAQGGERFGMISLAIQVDAGGGGSSGGCAAAGDHGGSGGWIVLLGALVLVGRKRRLAP
jgi:hypothetical protein